MELVSFSNSSSEENNEEVIEENEMNESEHHNGETTKQSHLDTKNVFPSKSCFLDKSRNMKKSVSFSPETLKNYESKFKDGKFFFQYKNH